MTILLRILPAVQTALRHWLSILSIIPLLRLALAPRGPARTSRAVRRASGRGGILNKGRPLFPFIKHLLRLHDVGGPAAASLASFTPVGAFASEALAGGASSWTLCVKNYAASSAFGHDARLAPAAAGVRNCSIFLEGEGLECRE